MSIPDIQPVRLEIVRPGKPHNQLLSPLTPYTALCGEGSAITFNVHLEHRQLLTRLERLRYATEGTDRMDPVPDRLRELEISELGSEVARILSDIPTLSTELARAQSVRRPGARDAIVHLRLIFSGSELSLIPFEMAVAPLAYPGEGLEFCLQASLPIVVTREIRRSRPNPTSWNRSSSRLPKILVAWAEPEGLRVPAQEHVRAIRGALEPWIRRLPIGKRARTDEPANDARSDAKSRLDLVKQRIRLLPNASIESIYRMCASETFTHVHLLAHGDTFVRDGEKCFGVALCRDEDSGRKEVVSGQRLVKALQAEDENGSARSEPLAVTLATCDSGNQSTVLAPGGSIAHDLHSEGIPWVFASQFPLTVPGSVRMAEILYPRLFRGDDPRQILFELRRQLYHRARKDHDWASIVAYASVSPQFENDVAKFSARQIKQAVNVSLEFADSLSALKVHAAEKEAAAAGAAEMVDADLKREVAHATAEVEGLLRLWRGRLPTGDSADDHVLRSDAIGLHGSTYKRLALLHEQIGDTEARDRFYRESLDYYRKTMAEAAATNQRYYWSATQLLSLTAITTDTPPDAAAAAYELALGLAKRDLESSDPQVSAWAHATLAELELLAAYYGKPSEGAAREALIGRVRDNCRAIVRLMGPRSFHVGSTLRQLKRYTDKWNRDTWRDIADAAIAALKSEGAVEDDFDFPDS